jgi:predicted alpha/beta hydrolase family esterase
MAEGLRVCIVPRWGGDETSDWYPFLRERLAARALPGVSDSAISPLLPEPDAPTVADSREGLAQVVGDEIERTVLVGHSVGARCALHYLASLPPGRQVAGLFCVAGWWTVDEPWESLRPWIEEPLDVERVTRAAGRVRVLMSDDDPFTADHLTTRRLWIERMHADVATRDGGRHFNGRHEISVLINLASLVAAVGG